MDTRKKYITMIGYKISPRHRNAKLDEERIVVIEPQFDVEACETGAIKCCTYHQTNGYNDEEEGLALKDIDREDKDMILQKINMEFF